jgi:anaerobic selenocysteine-containing dehydrogenase
VIERRQFLKTLGLAGSAAVLDSSCGKRTTEELIPYFVSADAVVAGTPAHYATTCRACPAGCGLVATVKNGRITKAEGNPQHPIGAGPESREWQETLSNWWTSQGSGDKEIVRLGGKFETAEVGHPHFRQSAPPRKCECPTSEALGDVSAALAAIPLPSTSSSLSFIAYPTAQLFDGRDADNSWLQELPDPVQKTAWGNSIEIHPQTAARLGIGEDDQVEIASSRGRVTARARLYSGLHPATVAMAIGYGRTSSMRFAAPRGANAIELLPASTSRPPSGGPTASPCGVRQADGG